MRNVLLHPTYLPSIEWYAASLIGDVTLERHDNFQKQTDRSRARIYAANGELTLTIPITKKGTAGSRQYQHTVPKQSTWLRTHWRSLESAYRTSPYFEFYEDRMRAHFQQLPLSLFDFNLKLIKTLDQALGLQREFVFTSSFHIEAAEQTDMRQLVSTKKRAVASFPAYDQVFQEKHGFIDNLSVVDLLFNLGPETLPYLRAQSQRLARG